MFQRIQCRLAALRIKSSLNARKPRDPDPTIHTDPDQQAAEARQTIETCNDYFRTLAALEDEFADLSDLDLQNSADRRLHANMTALRRLAPETARKKALAAAYLLERGDTSQESASSAPSADRDGWQLINGGRDHFVQLLDEVIHALGLLAPWDPEMSRIADLASARCRVLKRRASLQVVPARSNDPQ